MDCSACVQRWPIRQLGSELTCPRAVYRPPVTRQLTRKSTGHAACKRTQPAWQGGIVGRLESSSPFSLLPTVNRRVCDDARTTRRAPRMNCARRRASRDAEQETAAQFLQAANRAADGTTMDLSNHQANAEQARQSMMREENRDISRTEFANARKRGAEQLGRQVKHDCKLRGETVTSWRASCVSHVTLAAPCLPHFSR